MQECWLKSPSERKGFSSLIQNLLGFMGLTSVTSASLPDEDSPPLPLDDMMETEGLLDTSDEDGYQRGVCH